MTNRGQEDKLFCGHDAPCKPLHVMPDEAKLLVWRLSDVRRRLGIVVLRRPADADRGRAMGMGAAAPCAEVTENQDPAAFVERGR